MAHAVLVIDEKALGYPGSGDNFSPHEAYPEYPWGGEVSRKENRVYAMVRECLHANGYDAENYGAPGWNPLGDVIHPGELVLIKPNWVDHKNKNKAVHDSLACLVTNPAVVRAVADYVTIALKGQGRLIIGDAPMQGCHLDEMFAVTGYDRLFRFLREKGVNLDVADLRKYSVSAKYNGVLSRPSMTHGSWGGCVVDLGAQSMHAGSDGESPDYKVTDYRMDDTKACHSNGRHRYELNRIPIEADVIISIPKPKTHRLAGMTAGVKNMVGVTYEKACLPHRIEGAKEQGGDAYLRKSFWKERMHDFDERRTEHSINGRYVLSKWDDFWMKACYAIGAAMTGDKYRIGSWYGNDTIWRTAVDLNHALLYADRQGNLTDTVQRKVITIGDMIVCGQGEGPVGPDPKRLGMVMMADNALLFDRVMCEIMGFSHKKLPMFQSEKALRTFGFGETGDLESCAIHVARNGGDVEYEGKVSSFEGREEWRFEAHSCWRGHIER